MANENKGLGPHERANLVLLLGETGALVRDIGEAARSDPEATKLTIQLARDLNAFLAYFGADVTEMNAVLDRAEIEADGR